MKKKLILMISLLLTCLSVSAAELTDVVETEYGALQGLMSKDHQVSIYKGIPYAQAPVGSLRWQAPKMLQPWLGLKHTMQYQAGCYQIQHGEVLPWTKEFLHTTLMSEDCLYLNIWAPNSKSATRKPVIVFIHGGGFIEGSGSVPIYDGENLARAGVVFVTINYRLGEFGFLAASALKDSLGTTGNYGLQDQIAALKWIKENIGAFGGDPRNVTLVGQSAGANSILFLQTSPLTAGLFHQSVIESPTPAFYHNRGLTEENVLRTLFTATLLEQKIAATDKFLQEKGLTVKQLKAMSPEAVLKVIDRNKVLLVPAVDGYVLDRAIYDVLTTTHRYSGAVMLGFTQDDMSGFYPDYRIGGQKAFDKYVAYSYPSNAQVIMKLYPDKPIQSLNRQENMLATQALSKLLGRFTGNDVFSYYFNQPVAWEAQQDYGTFHTSEVPFLLRNLGKVTGPVTDEQRAVSTLFSRHLIQFVKTGDPTYTGHLWTSVSDDPKWIYAVNSNAHMFAPGFSAGQEAAIRQFGL
ncbi:carboxylesterase/lipase family protein [Vibrio mangrovi]|uniref:Carboxylic ester hydrolase n=1 Tax=Vibrio mangrovi TaxID=474394 RepID=A0A1Y6IPH9_9VIBR|nr:carboxylesterase family protein [Vibrio mangrovi]MDW6003643.1 carboxylesterase family protein [Vibrio mangrovi]SMR99565.1 Para-nitrobenzyl esterase [Vibrio mangrovi]